ncbi:MAG: LysM peptidoglycan-binding domain-containing protein, partial [Lysobacteraceae bacterium]
MRSPAVRGAWLLLCAWIASATALAGPAAPGQAAPVHAEPGAAAAASIGVPPAPASSQRNGREIYESFRAGLADPTCNADATSVRWKKHFGHAPGQLARSGEDLLPLFGYVVESLREASLPTEYALIPFVESGYKPGARSPSGPAGLWQFIGITARNHGVAMRAGYDGRLSPVDSTQAAVRYLKTLHGMFGGDWRLAVMAYNAGEYRLLQSMRSAGMNARNAKPEQLRGLSGITHAYVEKLHALACIFQLADDRAEWMHSLDRPVPRLASQALPGNISSLDAWANLQGHDPALLRRLNPALAGGISLSRGGKALRVLAPASGQTGPDPAIGSTLAAEPLPPTSGAALASTPSPPSNGAAAASGSHTVRRGESAWSIARRHGLQPQQLLKRNGLA